MYLVRLFFKLCSKLNTFCVSCWCYTVTWFKLHSLCDEIHDFKTAGIPFVGVSIRNKSSIRIGCNFRMNNGMFGNQIGFGNTPCVLNAENGKIIIGNNVGMSQSTLIASHGASLTIGDNTLLGGGVRIYTSDFHCLDYKKRRNSEEDQKNVVASDVSVGRDCFIGAGSVVLKGVSIGDRSIIGAGSVVTKSIPSDCIAAGNPCRVIRFLKENP